MKTVYTESHRKQHGRGELFDGEIVPPFENPSRAEAVLAVVKAAKLGEVIAPHDFGLAPLADSHDIQFLNFLKTAFSDWLKAGHPANRDALAHIRIGRGMRRLLPEAIVGRIAYYALDDTPITSGTWEAAYGSAQVALTAASLIASGESSAFALCRPPGHHAGTDYFGGYCFLNNAALAAEFLLQKGATKIAILDVDYHHGNGTQEMVYSRKDVLFLSIHGDPRVEYPYFSGYADERGTGEGEGYNVNYPLPHGTGWDRYSPALADAIRRIEDFSPDVLLISLGLDTFERDPISHFKLTAENYKTMGGMIQKVSRPTLFVFEGGYAIDALGENTVNVLSAFLAG